MSRAHMLYDDKALASIPVRVTNWDDRLGSCNPESLFQLKTRNSGVIAEGRLLGKSRHCIVDRNNKKYHYMVFHVDVKKGCRRKFLPDGTEIEPDFGAKQKVNTGFLMSSYKSVSKEGKDVLSSKELKDTVFVKELESLTKEKEDSFHVRSTISLWFIESDFDGMELKDNAEVRFRTRGEKCYLESIVCLDPETKDLSSFTTDKPIGGSWTDKVLAMKDSEKLESQPEAASKESGDCVDDDEWGD